MKSGLLLYDDSNKSFADKIAAAASRYTDKFGVAPSLCYVNAFDLPDPVPATRVPVKASAMILHNHFWIGVGSR